MPAIPPLLRLAPPLAVAALCGPVLAGLVATLLPAFGWLPALGGDEVSLEPWRRLLAEPGLARSVLLSVWTGLAATLLSLILAGGAVAAFGRTRIFGALSHLLSPLLAAPHAAVALGLVLVLAPSGLLVRLVAGPLGLTRPPDWLTVNDPAGLALILGLTVKEMPFLFLMMLAALPQAQAASRARLAASLGYGPLAGFLLTIWPAVYPQVRLAVLAVLAYSASVVDMAIVLGPDLPAPLAVRLTTWMSDPDLARRFMASAGAVLQLALVLALISLWWALERIGGALLRRAARLGARWRRDRAARGVLLLACLGPALLAALGLAALLLWSLATQWRFPDLLPGGLTLDSWRDGRNGLARPLALTVATGLLSAGLAVGLALALLERETRLHDGVPPAGFTAWARSLIFLPLLVPQIAFLFGLQILALLAGLDRSFFALLLAHLTFVFPYVLLALSDPWRALDPRFARAAAALGSPPSRVFWRVRLPLLLRPVLTAGALGLAVSVSLYLPTLLIGGGRWPSLATEGIALAAGGDRRLIGVVALTQLAVPALGFALAALVPALLHRRRAALGARL